MTDPTSADAPPPDWEAFYRDYRKPGYVEGFEITSKLGGGMFGLVFRARRMSIGKDYAIKFLKVDDGEVRRAVLSELEQVRYFAQIDHPNLVSIEDRGEVDGIPYLVMAFAGTGTLRDRMPVDESGQGRVPTAAEKGELMLAFLQCCRGLLALHERSLVHFDIKPANVFLKGGTARLGDYGLSKLVTHSRGSLSMGRGTPYYMAPEMLQRRGDQRSDVYSLGVMLYEILCGRVPFTGDSEWEVLRQHERATPELPAHLTAAERGALQRCLAKDPADRFQSVEGLLAAFGAPSSAGAAARSEGAPAARAQAGSPMGSPAGPPPPPDSAPEPRPATGEEDPYREMARASRKAFRHAQEKAREAMRDASRNARDAARKARVAWDVTRSHGSRHWRRMRRRLRRERRDGAARPVSAWGLAAIGRPLGEAVRSFGRGLRSFGSSLGSVLRGIAFVAVILLVLGVGMAAMWLSAGSASSGSITSAAVGPTPNYPSSVPTWNGSRTTERLASLVSHGEPDWALLYGRNRSAAKQQLLAHIGRLRKQAPYAVDSRPPKHELPDFAFDENSGRVRSLRVELQNVLAAPRFDRRAAARFTNRGALALAVAAHALRDMSWTGTDRRAAERIHDMLRRATGCRDIELSSQRLPEPERARRDRPVGALWMWFVNEFAHTERCWRVYRTLLRL